MALENFSIYTLISAAGAVLSILFGIYSIKNIPFKRSSFSFMLFSLNTAVFSICSFITLSTTNQDIASIWNNVFVLCTFLAPVVFFHFLNDFLGNKISMSKKYIKALFYLPSIVMLSILYLKGNIETVEKSFGYSYIFENMAAINMVFFVLFYFAAIIILALYTYNNYKSNRSNRIAWMLIIGLIMYVAGSSIVNILRSTGTISPFPSNAITILVFYLFIVASVLFDKFAIENIITERTLENMADGLLITDNHGKIVKLNSSMNEILSGKRTPLEFKDIDEEKIKKILFQMVSEKERIKELFIFAEKNSIKNLNREITLKKANTIKNYSITVSPIFDKKKKLSGKIIIFKDITEYLKTQERLRKERDYSKSLIDNTPAIACSIKSDGTTNYINFAGEMITGYSANEIIGKNWWKIFYPVDEYKQAERLLKELEKGDVRDYEMTHQTKDGNKRTVSWNFINQLDDDYNIIEIIGFGNDITASRRSLESVKVQHNLSTSLSNTSSIKKALKLCVDTAVNSTELDCGGIYIVDSEGNMELKYSNNLPPDFVKNAFSYTKDSPNAVIINKGKPVYTEYGNIGTEEDATLEENLLAIAIIPISHEGKVIACLNIASHKSVNISRDDKNILESIANHIGPAIARLEAQDMVWQEKENALKSKEEAIEANETKSRFLANMSHEIRTPMNAILGFSELLEDMVEDDTQKQYLSSIRSSGKSLLSLINDILDLSKIEAGKIEFEYAPVSLKQLFDEMVMMFAPKIEGKGLKFLISIDPDLPAALLLDEVRIRQIVFNLIGNAVKFTHQGYISLTVKGIYYKDRSKIDIDLIVKDTGIGISSENKKIIFEAFRQSKKQSLGKYGGTGLGLSITKRLVEAMGGKISLKSTTGRGSSFTVALNNIAVASVDKLPAKNDAISSNIAFKGQTILIVDDIESNRILIKEMLRSYDLKTIEAADGKKGLEMAAGFHPDLILMDLRMPVMDGYEAVAVLKADSSLKDIPVIVLTASAMKRDQEKIDKLSVEGHLRKPVKRVRLLNELARHLDHSEDKTEETIQTEMIENVLNSKQKKKLPKLMEILEGGIKDKLAEVSGSFIMDDIKDFAAEVTILGKEYNVASLERWAEKINSQADSFDMDGLSVMLNKFPEIIDKIKELLV